MKEKEYIYTPELVDNVTNHVKTNLNDDSFSTFVHKLCFSLLPMED